MYNGWFTAGTDCRLEARGMQVLVERAVHRVEFPEYQAFDAGANGVVNNRSS